MPTAHTRGMRSAALTFALRDGWTESERRDLTDALDLFQELLYAYQGDPPEELLHNYGHEYRAHDALY